MSQPYKIHVGSLDETKALAHRLALLVAPGDIITVEGQLGVGKTAFAKALGEGLGVKGHITSPTFTIVKEYEGEIPFYHMDAYRLEHAEEDIGFDEYFYGSGVTIVEWAQFIADFIPKERLEVKMYYVEDEQREWVLRPIGKHYEHLVQELLRT